MSKILNHKIVDVKKLCETENGFDIVEFTLDNGEKIEAPAKFLFSGGGELEE